MFRDIEPKRFRRAAGPVLAAMVTLSAASCGIKSITDLQEEARGQYTYSIFIDSPDAKGGSLGNPDPICFTDEKPTLTVDSGMSHLIATRVRCIPALRGQPSEVPTLDMTSPLEISITTRV